MYTSAGVLNFVPVGPNSTAPTKPIRILSETSFASFKYFIEISVSSFNAPAGILIIALSSPTWPPAAPITDETEAVELFSFPEPLPPLEFAQPVKIIGRMLRQ